MHRAAPGFTLLEVLIALLVVTVGLLGFAGTLRPAAMLAAEGRVRGRVALVLLSRMDRLRVVVRAGAPACIPPADGMAQHSAGIVESWRSTPEDSGFSIRIETMVQLPGGMLRDTLLTRISCR